MATQAEIAKFLGIAARTYTDIAKKLDIPAKSSIEFAVKTYVTHLREVAAGRMSEDGYDLTAERARLSHHQANIEELKEAQLRGDLIASEDVEALWAEMALSMRAKLLALPGKLASTAMAAQSLREVEDLARDEIYLALNELDSQEDTKKDASTVPAATKKNGKRVGSAEART